MDISDKIKGCFYGGAIGDCMGSIFENGRYYNADLLHYPWQITDDTQLTLATIESIVEERKAVPAKIASRFVGWYNQRSITGIGSSTLKALQELQAGGHWALSGRQGEYAAGNGAAMRVAPFAFINADRQLIRDICRITHRNDEAYTGALAILEGVRAAVTREWQGDNSLIELIVDILPDTRVRDRLIELQGEAISIAGIAEKYGNSGYVVHSVPLAVYAAQQVGQMGFEKVLVEIIKAGGDTDTTCSMAGNIMGAFIGCDSIPAFLLGRLGQIKEASLLHKSVDSFTKLVLGQLI
jgi:ADP-ribosylglycohydrolase